MLKEDSENIEVKRTSASLVNALLGLTCYFCPFSLSDVSSLFACLHSFFLVHTVHRSYRQTCERTPFLFLIWRTPSSMQGVQDRRFRGKRVGEARCWQERRNGKSEKARVQKRLSAAMNWIVDMSRQKEDKLLLFIDEK